MARTQRQVAIVAVLIVVAIVLAATVSWIFGIVAIGAVVALLDGARQNGLLGLRSRRPQSGPG